MWVSAAGTISGYQWQVSTDGGSTWNNLSNGAPYSNVTTATLTITNPSSALNNAQYRCLVTGSCGTVTSNPAVLTVNSNAISSQSTAGQTQCLGGIFDPISVTANGPGLSYQWYSNTTASTTGGTSLGSANGAQTDNFTPQATISGTLYYYCIVSGTCGNLTSAASGAFIVNAAPNASILLGNSPTCAGATEAFSVTNNAAWTYLWSVEDGFGDVTAPGNTSSVTIDWKDNAFIFVGALVNALSVDKKVSATVSTNPANGCPTLLEWNVTINRTPETGPANHLPNLP